MRITPDTNVLVSAFISKIGLSALLIDIALTFEGAELILSNEILDEFANVLSREEVTVRFSYSERKIKQFVSALRVASKTVRIKSTLKVVKEDPDDDIILNTTVDGRADYIVSGDSHLLNLEMFKGITIVSPKQMLEIVRSRFGEVMIPKSRL